MRAIIHLNDTEDPISVDINYRSYAIAGETGYTIPYLEYFARFTSNFSIFASIFGETTIQDLNSSDNKSVLRFWNFQRDSTFVVHVAKLSSYNSNLWLNCNGQIVSSVNMTEIKRH